MDMNLSKEFRVTADGHPLLAGRTPMTATRVLLVLLLSPAAVFAGPIFGNLRDGARSVGRGVEVQITCGRDAPYSTKTDEYGAFDINVPHQGKCELAVQYKGQLTRPYPIASSDDPARYDFDLIYENGGYILKRR
jgi:hypothetical protein